MTKETHRGKKGARLKLNKETVRDLDAREKGVNAKGGGRTLSAGCPGPVPIPYPDTTGCTAVCPVVTFACVTNGCRR